jgi:hypothetical protein
MWGVLLLTLKALYFVTFPYTSRRAASRGNRPRYLCFLVQIGKQCWIVPATSRQPNHTQPYNITIANHPPSLPGSVHNLGTLIKLAITFPLIAPPRDNHQPTIGRVSFL